MKGRKGDGLHVRGKEKEEIREKSQVSYAPGYMVVPFTKRENC